ncbi:hypothetical protein LIER_07436 [Lithospermum erythrorhizon]|uniref:Integrase zinc-binding domain-containing protein n=1 Tax=Lithospermum erythrorhizon TaxID=34254 RepID=A0AAV3PBZ0_LITER
MNDVAEYVKRCDSCQKMQVVPRQPVTEMTPVLCPIPFDMWGIDLVGQLFKPPVKYKDATVAVDYFKPFSWKSKRTCLNQGRSGTKSSIAYYGRDTVRLVYGTEVVLLLEVCLPNIWQIGFTEDQNAERMRELLDFGDEGRDQAIVKMKGPIGSKGCKARNLHVGRTIKERHRAYLAWIYLKKYYV